MTFSLVSLVPLFVALVGLQALLVVTVADRITEGSRPADSRRTSRQPGGRYVGIA